LKVGSVSLEKYVEGPPIVRKNLSDVQKQLVDDLEKLLKNHQSSKDGMDTVRVRMDS
jgi:hypothetical protein